MTTDTLISPKLPLDFSSFSLDDTGFLGYGPMLLDDIITLFDLIQIN